MRKTLMVLCGTLMVFAAAGVVAQDAATPPDPSQKKTFVDDLTIALDGKAQHDGGVRLVFQPNGGEAVEVTVGVVAKMRDKDIGDDIAKELKLVIGSQYELKAKGDELRIKKASKEVPFFTVYVTHWNVMGVGVRIDRR